MWVETRLRAVRDGEGELLCIRGTSQDVTEQEQAKQEVTTQAALLEEIDVAVIATDPDGRMHALEPRRRVAARLDSDEMVGRSAAEFLAPADAGVVAEVAPRAATGASAGRASTPFSTRTARRFPPICGARVMLDERGRAHRLDRRARST